LIVSQGKIIYIDQVSRKSKSFYYLLPGQGRGARKRFLRNHVAAVIVALITCALFAWICLLVEK
jgi:hypothetical protein